jgi:hypothetical protein
VAHKIAKNEGHPLQTELAVGLGKTPRKKPKPSPSKESKALLVQQTLHDFILTPRLPAGLLLSWIDQRFLFQNLTIRLTKDDAAALLEIFPPCVFVNGHSRAIIGDLRTTSSLLLCLDPTAEVRVTYVNASNRFAKVWMPIQLLQSPLPLADQISTTIDLHLLINSQKPNHQNLADTLGKTRSAVSKMLSKIAPDLTTDE